MQRSLDASAIIEAEFADGFRDEIDVVLRHDDVLHPVDAVEITRFGGTAVIKNNLDKAIRTVRLFQTLAYDTGENF